MDWEGEKIIETPLQILKGSIAGLSRPEDIQFSADGTICAISNSDIGTVTWYEFHNNRFVCENPFYVMRRKKDYLQFPHGLAFSADGKYFVVTQFGDVEFNEEGNLGSWGKERNDGFTVHKLN
jgi:hypothetical protein